MATVNALEMFLMNFLLWLIDFTTCTSPPSYSLQLMHILLFSRHCDSVVFLCLKLSHIISLSFILSDSLLLMTNLVAPCIPCLFSLFLQQFLLPTLLQHISPSTFYLSFVKAGSPRFCFAWGWQPLFLHCDHKNSLHFTLAHLYPSISNYLF